MYRYSVSPSTDINVLLLVSVFQKVWYRASLVTMYSHALSAQQVTSGQMYHPSREIKLQPVVIEKKKARVHT